MRKTQYAWMAMGGLICLFGLVLACKLRDGNRAVAQADKSSTPPPAAIEKELPPPPLPHAEDKPASVGGHMVTPEMLLPPKAEVSKPDIGKAKEKKEKPEAKAVLGKPSPEPSPLLPPPAAKPGAPSAPPPPASSPGLILPASFGPNTPTPKEDRLDDTPKGKPLPPYVPGTPKTADRPTDSKPVAFPPLGDGKPPSSNPSPAPSSDSAPKVSPASFAPTSAAPPSGLPHTDVDGKVQPGEPPLAPAPGPVQLYHVHGSETLQDIARRTLGSSERWTDLHKLNPALKPDTALRAGTTVRLPGDACVQNDEVEPVKPLPALRPKPTPPKAKVLPLTGTYQCSLDEKNQLTLPRALRDQLAGSDTVLISPGPDKCLWLTNHPHLERLAERLEQSQANEMDVRVFKRLYYAQTEKLPVNGDGRVALPDRLAQFAGLHQELVLVGIDDHFEVWDAARWRQYTQQKSATVTHSSAASDSE